MPLILVNGVRYHVEAESDGAPVMLLHGFTGSAASWDSLLNGPFRTVMPDLLGHGETDSPDDPARYRMEYAAADLATLIESLKLGPVHLLGYSMGGRLALYTALHYPDLIRSLILESASPGLAAESERQARKSSDDTLADRIERDGIPAFVEEWEKLPLFATQQNLPESVRARLHAQRLRNNPRGLANSLRGMGTGVQPSLWESLPQMSVPTLLLAGALDTKFTAIARAMHAQIPGAELAIIPDAGHTIHREQPGAYTDCLQAWLHRE